MAKMYTCDEVAERYKVRVITVWDFIYDFNMGTIISKKSSTLKLRLHKYHN